MKIDSTTPQEAAGAGSSPATCSRLRNPWSWKYDVFQIACWSFITGSNAIDAFDSGWALATAVMGVGIIVLSVIGISKGIAWEKENSSENDEMTSPHIKGATHE